MIHIGHKNVVVLFSLLSDVVKPGLVIGFRPIKMGKSAGELLRRVYLLGREGYATWMSPEHFLCKWHLELLQASGAMRRTNQHIEKG